MQKWEYVRLTQSLDDYVNWTWADGSDKNPEERLTEMGREGWELVSVAVHGRVLDFYFKRPTE